MQGAAGKAPNGVGVDREASGRTSSLCDCAIARAQKASSDEEKGGLKTASLSM